MKLPILIQLIDKPHAQKFYRQLMEIYQKENKINEAEAFRYLIENKFSKNDEKINSDNSSQDK